MEAQADTTGSSASRAVELVDMPAPTTSSPPVALTGPPVPPQGRIQLYSADDWEEFIREWVTGLSAEYVQVKRFGGSGDKGADIAAFKSEQGLEGPWDCFQGKHYSKPLNFGDAAPEILKVFLAVFDGYYGIPDSYQFLAPKGCGTELNRLLSLPSALKEKFLAKLVAGEALVKELDPARIAAVRSLAERADFSLFKSVEVLDALEVHKNTCYHTARFGTKLTARPEYEQPPENIAEHETRYLEQLLAVYAERHPDQELHIARLANDSRVGNHFQRQRVTFYKAESLRVYARDSVPVGTFEKLQEDIHSGVVDTADADHPSGYARLTSVLTLVGQLDLNRHTLITVVDNDDRKGICHQLANNDRLTWAGP